MEKINLTAYKDPKSPISEAYRTIRTNIQFAGVDKPMQVIIVTSATPHEGKSTVIASLAIVLAQAGKKVLLMDCDFRNPTQHKLFGLENKGTTNYVATGEPLANLLQAADQANLTVLPSGPVPPNPSEILTSQKYAVLLEKLKKEYDYILLDTPPVLPVTDASALSTKADGVLLVVASNEISPSEAKLAKTRLELAGAKIIGCVLNKVDVAPHGYGYGYGKYGNYGYYYYYGHEGDGKEHHHHHEEATQEENTAEAK